MPRPFSLFFTFFVFFVSIGGSFTIHAAASQVKPHASAPSSFSQMVKPLIPAVVNISTTTKFSYRTDSPQGNPSSNGSPFDELFKDFFERMQPEGPRQSSAVGSGFIIDPDGYIVTNNHLVSDADHIIVTLNDNTELKAELVGRDRRTDIAVLKVDAGHKLPYVDWTPHDDLQVGDWIIAIGNPFGLGSTVTSGIASHLARDIGDRPGQPDTSDFVDGYIQTDASINLGNSGGPMFDMNGKVVGIITAIFSPTGGNVGIGFAIPTDIAKKVVDQILKYGRTKRGWIGVRIQMVTEDIADNLGLKSPAGALIGSIVPNGPADKSMLKSGDVILKVAQQSVTRSKDLPRMVGNRNVGEQVPLTVWRKGKEQTINITVGEYEEAEKSGVILNQTKDKTVKKGIKTQGLTLQPLTPETRQRLDIDPTTTGVLVVDVDPDYPAANRGIRSGDVIVEISQEDVHTPQDVAEKILQAAKVGRKSVLLLVNRNSEVRYIAVQLAEPGGKI